jgi:hydrogen peroxide-dependent heme synthase
MREPPHDSDVEAVSPTEGWTVLHLFCHRTDRLVGSKVLDAVAAAIEHGHQVVTSSILGHKADLCLMVMGPDWRVQRQLQTDIAAAGLTVTHSYVSLSEVSEYARNIPGGITDEMKAGRLYPVFPPDGYPAFCFYPMSKKRGEHENWFSLPYEEREAMMRGHGTSGRKFAGRIVQFITGSTGLDDYEWGVTLFGRRPDDIKDVVYTMRFDEASARFAEFGPFWVGVVTPLADLVG